MAVGRRQVELLEKNKPRQDRAKKTYEAILAAAAQLLMEVGVERISTNLVAEKAGITVPALYRYFPNKYAVLNALGAVLMDKQNVVFDEWLEKRLAEGGGPQSLMDNIYELLWKTYEVTREQAGGIEVVQALRAVAPLQDVLLASHRVVADQLAQLVAEMLGRPVGELLSMQARLTIDTGYSIVEMALEDESLAPEPLIREGAHMLQRYWHGALLMNEGSA